MLPITVIPIMDQEYGKSELPVNHLPFTKLLKYS